MENLKGSSRILGYIGSEWREVSSRLSPLVSLKKTLQAMRFKVHSLKNFFYQTLNSIRQVYVVNVDNNGVAI